MGPDIIKTTHIHTTSVFGVVVAGLTLLSANAHATLILQPSELKAGDQYRLVFVTSGTRDATSSDIQDYNAFVQVSADQSPLASLGQTWFAIGSTFAVHARDNTRTNPSEDGLGVPIFLVDGSLVATDNNELWDQGLMHPINVDEHGQVVFSSDTAVAHVWTGSDPDGTAAQQSWLGGSFPTPFLSQRGRVDRVDSEWIRDFAETNVRREHLYGMSDIIIAIPEPMSVSLIVIVGNFLVGTSHWRLWRRSMCLI